MDSSSRNSASERGIVATPTPATVKKSVGTSTFELWSRPGVHGPAAMMVVPAIKLPRSASTPRQTPSLTTSLVTSFVSLVTPSLIASWATASTAKAEST